MLHARCLPCSMRGRCTRMRTEMTDNFSCFKNNLIPQFLLINLLIG